MKQKKWNGRSFRMEGAVHSVKTQERLRIGAMVSLDAVYRSLCTSALGLTEEQVVINRQSYGSNAGTVVCAVSELQLWQMALCQPFVLVLLSLCCIALITDVAVPLWQERFDGWHSMSVGVTAVLAGLTALYFVKGQQGMQRALDDCQTVRPLVCQVIREGVVQEIKTDELVVGDVVVLTKGEVLTADMRIVEGEGLLVRQETVDGCIQLVGKRAVWKAEATGVTGLENLVLGGTEIVEGKGLGLVLAVGERTVFGNRVQPIAIMEEIKEEHKKEIPSPKVLWRPSLRRWQGVGLEGKESINTDELVANKVFRCTESVVRQESMFPTTTYQEPCEKGLLWPAQQGSRASAEQEEPPER